MTPQEIFDFVCSKLAVQKKRAYENGSCVYLTSDGKMCAVGHLLPELGLSKSILVKLQIFRGSVDTLITCFQEKLPGWFVENEALLKSLQIVHDDNCINLDKDYMANKLENVALKFNLVFDKEAFLRKAGL